MKSDKPRDIGLTRRAALRIGAGILLSTAVAVRTQAAEADATGQNTARGPDNPLPKASVVWHMKPHEAGEIYPLDFEEHGTVRAEKLEGNEWVGSLQRGSDGFVAALNNKAYFSLDRDKAATLRPGGNAVSLYVRAWIDPSSTSQGTFFFSDFLALSIHRSGLAIARLGVKTPKGKVYRELPLSMIQRGGGWT